MTKKNIPHALNKEGLDAAVEMLAREYKRETRLVVVHGAGSFGHFEAKEYGLAVGSQRDGDMPLRHRIGAALCRQAVTRLNHMVVSALIDKGVPAMGVSPFPTTTTYGSGVAEKDGSISHVQRLLERGYVPVVHGDFVFDQKRKFSILGGDAILERVCADLKPAPSRAVFVTDVAGIYDRPPGSPGEPRLLERIRVDPRTGRALDTFETSELGHDVTGGIAAKVAAAARVVAKGRCPVFIVKVGSDAARRAIAGDTVELGTATQIVPWA